MTRKTNNKTTQVRPAFSIAGRLTVMLAIVCLCFSCATVPGLREETGGNPIRVPFVRVLLDEANDMATVSADHAFAVECLTDGKQQIYYSSNPVEVRAHNGRLMAISRGQAVASGVDEINILPRGNDNLLWFAEARYRGILKFLPHGQNVRVVNVVYMEDYLRGVVPPELGPRIEEEIESVKAQAVAARTYAMAHLQQYGNQPYDLKSSIMDQLYHGVEVETPLVNRAINATAGNVLMYDNDFIDAYYHSTCGGMTDDIAHVWDRPERPYLKPVADSGACSWSKYYTWTEHFTESQLRSRIEQYLASDRGRDLSIGRILEVRAEDRTPGGRVARLIVRTTDNTFTFTKDRIRWVVRRTSRSDLILPSDNFVVDVEKDFRGELSSVTFRGRGYGHGVGMCQCGAIGLSRNGWTFEQILTHYYTAVDVRKLY